MIIPAVVYKILGFRRKIGDSDLSLVPKDGYNVALIQMDDGSLNEVSYYGNNKEMNSLYEYLENKAKQGLKKDKITAYVADLSMTEDPELLKKIEDKAKELAEQGKPNSKKEVYTAVATDILKEKVSIRSGSIIRSALAFTVDENGFSSRFNSRSIISFQDKDGAWKYSTTGLYSQATLSNQIPIEISPIRKSDGTFVGFFRLVTGTIISRHHVESILNHSIRTIENAIEQGANALLPKIVGDVVGNSELNMIKNKINQAKQKLDALKKEKKTVDAEEYRIIISDLKKYKELLFADKKNLPKFKMELPLIVSAEDFKSKTVLYVPVHGEKRPEDLSPFRVFADAVISLNFSKEDPSIKTQAKDYIVNAFLGQISNGNYAPRMLLNYNLPKGDILDNNDSWGYMVNNVDFSKLVLSFVDSKYIISEVERYIEEIKQ